MAGLKLREKVIELYSAVIQYGGKPTDAQIYYVSILEEKIKQAEIKFKNLVDKKLKSINSSLAKKKLGTLKVMTKEEYDKKS
jgi:hypothetical protein